MKDKEYELTKGDKRTIVLIAGLVSVVISILMYRSIIAMVVFFPVYIILKKRQKKELQKKRDREMQDQFLMAIQVVSTSLQAGLSMEKAWIEAEKEIQQLYGNDSYLYVELAELNRLTTFNMPFEKLFMEFANRTGLEDVIWFAEILGLGKKTGGNWRRIITDCVYRMSEKEEVKKQIQVMVAEKKLEQQVMNVIPLGILAFLQIASWDYMSVLYHNAVGVICMTIFLFGYGAAVFLSEKILEIQV